MNYTKTFLLFLSISLFSQPILLHAKESTASRIVKEAGSMTYNSAKCAASMAFDATSFAMGKTLCGAQFIAKKLFDHKFLSFYASKPLHELALITATAGKDTIIIVDPDAQHLLWSYSINPYQSGSTIFGKKSNAAAAIAVGIAATYGSLYSYKKYWTRYYNECNKRIEIHANIENFAKSYAIYNDPLKAATVKTNAQAECNRLATATTALGNNCYSYLIPGKRDYKMSRALSKYFNDPTKENERYAKHATFGK